MKNYFYKLFLCITVVNGCYQVVHAQSESEESCDAFDYRIANKALLSNDPNAIDNIAQLWLTKPTRCADSKRNPDLILTKIRKNPLTLPSMLDQLVVKYLSLLKSKSDKDFNHARKAIHELAGNSSLPISSQWRIYQFDQSSLTHKVSMADSLARNISLAPQLMLKIAKDNLSDSNQMPSFSLVVHPQVTKETLRIITQVNREDLRTMANFRLKHPQLHHYYQALRTHNLELFEKQQQKDKAANQQRSMIANALVFLALVMMIIRFWLSRKNKLAIRQFLVWLPVLTILFGALNRTSFLFVPSITILPLVFAIMFVVLWHGGSKKFRIELYVSMLIYALSIGGLWIMAMVIASLP